MDSARWARGEKPPHTDELERRIQRADEELDAEVEEMLREIDADKKSAAI